MIKETLQSATILTAKSWNDKRTAHAGLMQKKW
jgi:hypothetical protein